MTDSTDLQPPYPGRWIGIDYGTARVGIAVSDIGGVIASPRQVLAAKSHAQIVAALRAIIREYEATEDPEEMPVGIVIGDPRHMHGAESEGSRQVQALRDHLREALDAVVTLWDERLTTVMADAALADAGVREHKRGDKRDAVAAALLLQSYLEYLRGRAAATGEGAP